MLFLVFVSAGASAALLLLLLLLLSFQGVKAVVYDGSSRQVVGRGAQPWSIIESNVPGRAEQHPKTWLEVRERSGGAEFGEQGGGGCRGQ